MRSPARLRRHASATSAEPAGLDLFPTIPDPLAPPALQTPRAAAWWIIPTVLLVGGSVCAMAWWLLSGLPTLPKAAGEASARQGAIQTALALGAGIGAAITVLLAFRRQHHQEHAAHVTAYLAERNARLAEQVAEHNRQDATERRVTELYTKAVEQLGSDKAPVRLGGLYALERLAQDNPGHRQTIVNVICAYLRMPYVPPSSAAQRDAVYVVPRMSVAGASIPVHGYDPHEERQVRLAAQRVLAEHLRDWRDRDGRSINLRFWEAMEVDLTGATLTDFDFTGCRPGFACFNEVRFVGGANFAHAKFDTDAFFRKAHFEEKGGHFYGAWFGRRAVFVQADFGKCEAVFRAAHFCGMTFFGNAKFDGGIRFDEAKTLLKFDSNWGSERRWPVGWTVDENLEADSGWGRVVPATGS